MERLQQLISKLNDQCEQNESALQMLVTLKQIEAELTHQHTVMVTGRKNPGVSVVMPSLNIGHRSYEEYLPKTKPREFEADFETHSVENAPPGHKVWMGEIP